jgi:SanA protein
MNILLLILFIIFLALGVPRLISEFYSKNRIFTTADAPKKSVAIVFGAGLYRDGSATPVLRHRIETAAELYFQGKVQKLLMSGDNRFVEYNEPAAMLEYALQLGVPQENIVLDYAGRRTYDTCYRAKEIFQVNDVLLVTQRFHLPRAIFICNKLGLEAKGVSANRTHYTLHSQLLWNTRELPATLIAFWEVLVSQPEPILGKPEPISDKIDNKTEKTIHNC